MIRLNLIAEAVAVEVVQAVVEAVAAAEAEAIVFKRILEIFCFHCQTL